MRLYHGSDILVYNPNLEKGKPFKDFGKGFYLSSDLQQAMAMASQKAALSINAKPIVTTFEFNENVLSDGSLKIKKFETYSEEWAKFVLKNRDRKTAQPCHNFDIVYGPIADDKVVRQMRRFEMGDISLKELMRELKYPKGITFQYFFGTEKALKALTFIC
ncbi:MAG: DUF3990 domain-containing protein [Paludibacteraceae bacterium]|nr:DUF3990 domain-containing protein [Paludibacteraceae bacterium]